ncbi:MAG: ABC transporter permease [Candidatus Methylomirabilales bacterium]
MAREASLRVSLPVITLWWREMVRFCRQRSRLVGAFVQPLLFWILLGGGFSASFRPPGVPEGTGSVEYFYPGIITLILLFTAVFATISIVEDRREGFLQEVLVAPVTRTSVVLGQALGGTTLAMLQGILFLLLAPAAGLSLSVVSVLTAVGVMFLVSFALTSLGLLIAWRMDSVQGFHAIMNLILIPIWLLSGAFFPASGVPTWLQWAMKVNPLTYGVAALRRCLYLANPAQAGDVPPLLLSVVLTVLFGAVAFAAAAATARRSVA